MWKPITTAAEVERLVAAHAPETEHLDFKREHWSGESARAEAAKDIAAFLNAMGGTIVLGVTDEGGQAGKILPMKLAGNTAQDFRQWLRPALTSSSAADYVDFELLETKDGTVAAVNVRPWPHGVVGVRWSSDGGLLRFPIREGTRMRDMAWEVVVMRNPACQRE